MRSLLKPKLRWLPLAIAVLGWHPLLAGLDAVARAQPGLRWLALLLAFALPAAGAAVLLGGPDLRKGAGRRLRLWGHLATLAPVIATILRVPPGLPERAVWLGGFGLLLAGSLWRSLRKGTVTPSAAGAVPRLVLTLHRASAAIIVAFALLHMVSHLSAAISLAANTRVVEAVRLVYKWPPVEVLLLLAVAVQIVTGLWLFRAARDREPDRWDRLQQMSGLYLALFLAGHTTATALLFRGISFRAASGGASGLFADPSFLAYYVLAPLALFAHLACGARMLMLWQRGPVRAGRRGAGVLGLGAAVTLVIALALCGVHLRNDRKQPQPPPANRGATLPGH